MLAPPTDTTVVMFVCSRVCYSHLTDTQRGARAHASTAHRISVMMGVCVCVLVCIIIILQTHNVTLALMLACLIEIYIVCGDVRVLSCVSSLLKIIGLFCKRAL